MPRGTQGQPVPERGALVIGHLYPNTFAWIIKTGPAVNREWLATSVENLSSAEVMEVYRAATTEIQRAGLDQTMYIDIRTVEGLAKATKIALRQAYANHGNDRPKGKARIRLEAIIIRHILTVAARRLRGSN